MKGYYPRREWTGTPKHLKAMGVHRGLAVFYGAIAVVVLATLTWGGAKGGLHLELPLVLAAPAAIHGLIALGASRANPLAQVFSVLAALLMLLAVPIGTVIGIYLLRNASWRGSDAET